MPLCRQDRPPIEKFILEYQNHNLPKISMIQLKDVSHPVDGNDAGKRRDLTRGLQREVCLHQARKQLPNQAVFPSKVMRK